MATHSSSSPKTVIAFQAETLDGVSGCRNRHLMDLLAPLGLVGHVLNVNDPAFPAQLEAALRSGILFAWGENGAGARLALQGCNLWTTTGIPFISVLPEAPFIMPSNHHVASPAVVNGYVHREWLDFQRNHIRSPQITALVPMAVIPNTDCLTIPWSYRPIRMLFVKTGADPARQRATWARWPARLRTVLHECADALLCQPSGSIVPTVMACLATHQLHLDGGKTLLFGLLHELDTYLRAHRATAMARAMLHLPVDIFGTGWDHVRNPGGTTQARFHDAGPAEHLDTLYSQAQYVVTVTPNVADGADERVLRGFAARACIISNDDQNTRDTLHSLPSYHVVDCHDPDLPDLLADRFHDATPYDDRLDAAQDYVERHHDPAAFLGRLRDLADVVRAQPNLACYALDAA